MTYLRETVAENGIRGAIRFGHKVIAAAWSTPDARWLVEIERVDTGEHVTMSCGWFFCASGYYRYDEGFAPEFPGRERFTGQIVHPQHWPEDMDYRGKRVVIIGSGATAVTLVPAMADTAGHVTMLQRSPTYIVPVPSEDRIANTLPKLIGRDRAYAVTRRKNVAKQRLLWRFCKQYPGAARRLIRHVNAKQLPAGYPVDEHFRPAYNPWDQRLCAVPDADMFKAVRDGTSLGGDRSDRHLHGAGNPVASGRELEADIVVTATGLNLMAFGGINFSVDGVAVNIPEKVAFKGFLLSDVPNFAYVFGYTNSSWTLKVGLVCEHFCRLLAHMDAQGHTICYPQLPESMPTRPFLEITSGYAKRAAGMLPKQGAEGPWRTSMAYRNDRRCCATAQSTTTISASPGRFRPTDPSPR